MKTYHGSCFCGAVAFEADGDLADGTMRCNCRFCRKMRYWEMRLPDPDGLRVLQGQDHVAETPRSGAADIDMHHCFCGTCGTRLWSRGTIAELGGRVTMVFVPALDDAAQDELIAAPVYAGNGAANDWGRPAPETRHL
ncbi:GFA family protein [Paracoccus luteus]|uniref:GFA family protein n=1 Tax=Paracoccus luteus TaxID=2508543 RepID=UPI00106F81BA|nr:GFA family protein [Paracoccus luteus]